MDVIKPKVLVLGGGPGGYVCAIRTAQHGLDTVLVDSGPVGGTCLNVGCIPSKAIIHAADVFSLNRYAAEQNELGITSAAPTIDLGKTTAWKDAIVKRLNGGVKSLLKKHGVKVVTGHGVMQDGKSCRVDTIDGPVMIKSEHTVIATGSEPIGLAELPFGERVLSSTETLALNSLPESMLVIGGGYIGLELGGAFARMGTTLTVVEAAPKLLPRYDGELTEPVTSKLSESGATVLTNTRVTGGNSDLGQVDVEQADGTQTQLSAAVVLVTVGRRARLTDWGIEALDLEPEHGVIPIDGTGLTRMTGVWAIGDVTGEPMLAHRAMAQAEIVADNIAGHARTADFISMPEICFTSPEIVHLGRIFSPDDMSDDQIVVRQFPLAANGRSMTMQESTGFIRVSAEKTTGLVLGIQAVGEDISELSASFSLALEMGATLEDIAGTIHAHPTRSEAFQEAAMMALNRPVHI